MSYNSTPFWPNLPGDCIRSPCEGLSPTSLSLEFSTPDTGCKSRLSPVLWLAGCRLEVPVNPSLGSIKLLEWLRELNETFYLLDDELIRKGYDSGTARWKRQLEPVQVKGPELPCPFWAQHFFLISTYSPTPKLCKAYPFGFLHRQVWLNHWPGKLIQPSNPLLFRRVKVNGLESFKPLISMQILTSLTWLKIS